MSGVADLYADKKAGTIRAALLAALFLLEIPLLAFLFDPLAINATDEVWLAARAVLRNLVPFGCFFAVALALALAPHRRELAGEWRSLAPSHQPVIPLAANLALFVAHLAATALLNTARGAPPWGWFILWLAAAAAMTALLALAAAPAAFWRGLVRRRWPAFVLAAGAASLTTAAAILSQQSWNGLSEGTFRASAFVLSLYESDVIVEPARRILGVGDFEVNIAAACSGYEGAGMIVAFLSIYLWFFRKSLKFPQAFLLYPAGLAAILALNAVRIAVLVSLGAHVSEEVALAGFHSQAGWMMFLAVTISLMVVSQKLAFFAIDARRRAPTAGGEEAVALLAPFLAVTAAGIALAAASADAGAALYPLKAAAGAAAILLVAHRLQPLRWFSAQGAAIGVVVGVLWIATNPPASAPSAIPAMLERMGPAIAALWLAARCAGTVLVVPVAEELAFRGYLHRKLVADRFETTAEAAFSWRAFLVSSVLFGAIHERWLAGALAGAAFAFALYRTGRIGGAISAHAAANLVIFLFAVAARDWSLL